MLMLYILLLFVISINIGQCIVINTVSVSEGSIGCPVFQFDQQVMFPVTITTTFNNDVVLFVRNGKPTFTNGYVNRTTYTGNLNERRISFCLQNVTLSDAGEYNIVIDNKYTNVLTVLVALTEVRIDPAQDFELDESKTKLFQCFARSIPLANITWYIGGSAISASGYYAYTDKVISNLTYTGNRSDHNKLLYCSADNGTATVESLSAHIYIIYAPAMNPKVEASPEGGIIAGTNVTLKCSIKDGNPLPVLKWNCSSAQEQNNTAGNQSMNSVAFPVNKADNNKICACSATHPIESYRPVAFYRLVVFCMYKMKLDKINFIYSRMTKQQKLLRALAD